MKSHSFLFLIAALFAVSLQAQKKDSTATIAVVPQKFPLLTNIPLTVNGYTQARFVSNQQAGQPDGFDIRRARLSFKGQIDKHWDYRLQFDLAGSPRLLDAALSYKFVDWFKISAGQFYIPLSAENTTADNQLFFIDRSQVVNALAARDKDIIGNQNGRDPGVQLSGEILKKGDRSIVGYYIGVFNGAGINIPDNNEAKDFAGRLVLHPFTGLDIGGSYYNGWAKIGPASQARNRYEADLAYTWKFVSVQGEYLDGWDGKIHRSGYYASAAAYVYKKNVQLVARYDAYDPDISPEKLNDVITNYTFGVNLYFNPSVKLQINYTSRIEQGTQINNDLIAAQLQLGF